MKKINTILYNDFETLDVFGPIEIFGRLKEYFDIGFYSKEGGIVKSSQSVPILTESFDAIDSKNTILLVPGGFGARLLFNDEEYIKCLKKFGEDSEIILTVCTGSILFSKTGLLDGRRATSNKRVFNLTGIQSPKVNWIKKARWVKDGNIYTSSGVSAGLDMTLGFISDVLGHEVAKKQSIEIEYDWNEDKDRDPFSEMY